MAMTKEQLALMEKRRALDAQIKKLKEQAVDARNEYDKLTNRLNLEHKLGKMTPEEKQSVMKMLN